MEGCQTFIMKRESSNGCLEGLLVVSLGENIQTAKALTNNHATNRSRKEATIVNMEGITKAKSDLCLLVVSIMECSDFA